MKTLITLMLGVFLSGCVVTTEGTTISTTGPITGNKYDYDVLKDEVVINETITIEGVR